MKYKKFAKLLFEQDEKKSEDKKEKKPEKKEEPIPNGAKPEEELSPEEELQLELQKRFEEYAEVASKMLEEVIENKTELFMGRIKSVGIDVVMQEFVEQRFIKELKKEDQLFLTVNMVEFVEFMIAKFSEHIMKK